MNNLQILCGIAESISIASKFTIIITPIEKDYMKLIYVKN